MRCLPLSLLLALLSHPAVQALSRYPHSYDTHNYYVIEHNPSGTASLAEITNLLGVQVVERVGELANYWLVRTEKELEARNGQLSDRVLDTYKRLKANAPATSNVHARSEDVLAKRFDSSVKYISRQELRQRVKRAPPPPLPPPSSADTSARGVAERFGIQDPLFPDQWHLVNDENPEHMMNVTPVWEMGITGKGVISSLVDDGLDYTSVDLKDNFDVEDSYDFNDHDKLPTPKLPEDHHGTRCAGQIAAQKNNACGIGIAYESKVAGVRILSGPISDADEAAALNYGFQNVSIYSCSWGPPDNGQSMEGPSQLIQQAVLNGINNGRGGLGSIFVFASGNGAARGDQCNFDGYTNSVYSVTVSAIDHKGLHPYYSEPCAANMIVAYSSGSGKHIVTTDRGEDSCSSTHGGTSAAAPNAVGVFALALQVRPDLTWRDVQHLCVQTARMINPDDPDWEPTAEGRLYSYKYGFGALDAARFVSAAKDWKNVKPQAWLKTKTVVLGDGKMTEDGVYSGGKFITPAPASPSSGPGPRSPSERSDPNAGVRSVIQITQEMLNEHNFEKLEHLNVKVWIDHAKRGDVEVEVTSPGGITSVLAGKRKSDQDTTGYPGWTFMSVKHWGENAVGNWTIRVSDQSDAERNGTFLGWNMMLWGSAIDSAQAKLYELPEEVTVFPPPTPSSPVLPTGTSTRIPTRPTDHLPGDHGTAPGENTNPAFPSGSPTSTPTPDEGWFSDLAKLAKNQKWFFGAIGVVAVFAIGAGLFFWRRRILTNKKRGQYESLAGEEDVHMSSMDRGGVTGRAGGGNTRAGSARQGRGTGTTKELYDAFGEVSDDDEDVNEETRLRPHSRDRIAEVGTNGLGFHSGFLDDEDEPSSPRVSLGGYRDDPPSGRQDTSHS
ncbi:kex protein [Moniliophthora roreri MCA 2997]|uniref:Kex protein n=2 Tax=Moniliophthora roreri TaxID=221103 RepID=V2X4Y2_MONRO|nr:kex protein [Moniliophthora roreri MCA 2997]KAI3619374.1 kex protein [Moniliophthora roreri]